MRRGGRWTIAWPARWHVLHLGSTRDGRCARKKKACCGAPWRGSVRAPESLIQPGSVRFPSFSEVDDAAHARVARGPRRRVAGPGCQRGLRCADGTVLETGPEVLWPTGGRGRLYLSMLPHGLQRL